MCPLMQTILFYSFSSNLKDTENNLNEVLLNIDHWLNENKLTLNLGKTKSMLISSERRHIDVSNIFVSVFDKEIKGERNLKYLGLVISSNTTWTDHIDHILSGVNKLLGLLRRIKHLLPYSTRILFYNSFILPIFEYVDVVLGDKNNTILMSSLQVLPNKAAEIISDKPFHSSDIDALNSLGWLNLEQRRRLPRCLQVKSNLP